MYTDVKPYFVLTHINWKRAEQARDDEKSEYYSLHSIFNCSHRYTVWVNAWCDLQQLLPRG